MFFAKSFIDFYGEHLPIVPVSNSIVHTLKISHKTTCRL